MNLKQWFEYIVLNVKEFVVVERDSSNRVTIGFRVNIGLIEDFGAWVFDIIRGSVGWISGFSVEQLMLIGGISSLIVLLYWRTRSMSDIVMLLIVINGVFLVSVCFLMIIIREAGLFGECFTRLVEWVVSKITMDEESRERIRELVRFYLQVISGVIGWKLGLLIVECVRRQSFSPMLRFGKEVIGGVVIGIFSVSILIVDWGISVVLVDAVIHGVLEDLLQGIEGVIEWIKEAIENFLGNKEEGDKEEVGEDKKGKEDKGGEEESEALVNPAISFGGGWGLEGPGLDPEGDVKSPEVGCFPVPEGKIDELNFFLIEEGKVLKGDYGSSDGEEDGYGSGGCVIGDKV